MTRDGLCFNPLSRGGSILTFGAGGSSSGVYLVSILYVEGFGSYQHTQAVGRTHPERSFNLLAQHLATIAAWEVGIFYRQRLVTTGPISWIHMFQSSLSRHRGYSDILHRGDQSGEREVSILFTLHPEAQRSGCPFGKHSGTM